MQKYILIFTTMVLIGGCNQRECLDKESYNGIYNALTCNYQSRIDKLENSISNEEITKSKQFMEYQELLAKFNNKEQELLEYKNSIRNLDGLIDEIKIELKKLDTNQDTKPLLYKIRHQVISMRNKMQIQQPYFEESEIRVAQKQIKDESIKKPEIKDYSEKYKKNSQVQKKIEDKLTQSIKKILMSEKANHLSQKDKKELLLALQDTKRYTTTIK